jgi:non-ribosomal peptide synthetase component E (peptide arylation enzyme)
MDFDPVLILGRREEMVERGLWHDRTINDYLDGCLAAHPDKPALVARRVEDRATRRFSCRELVTMADRIALGRDRGAAVQAPSVVSVAIVAYSDERLGERAGAFVTLRPGQQLSFKDMSEFLGAQKIARQYIPERLEVRDALPATPSGKIQKFKLREMLEAQASARGTPPQSD